MRCVLKRMSCCCVRPISKKGKPSRLLLSSSMAVKEEPVKSEIK